MTHAFLRGRNTAKLRVLLGGCAAAILSVAALPPEAKASYVTFEVPGASQTYALVIDGTANVAGDWSDTNGVQHGYVRTSNGTISTFDPSNSCTTYVDDMNDNVVTVGGFYVIDGQLGCNGALEHGFFRQSDGSITVYDAPGSNNATEVYGINDKGMFEGEYCDSNGNCPGFIVNARGKFTSYNISGSIFIVPWAMNQGGAIAGEYFDSNYVQHGYVRAPNGTLATFDPQGSILTRPFGINSTGVVAGGYRDSNNVWHGFMRAADGTITTIDHPLGVQGTVARNINDKGVIVGWYTDSNGINHGFERSPAGNFRSFDPKGSTGTHGADINDTGQISGGFTDKNNVSHGYVRTP